MSLITATRNALPALFAAACLAVASAQADNHAGEDAPAFKTAPLKGPLHLLQGKGGNIVASVGDDGVLLIDADYTDMAPAYARAVRELSASTDTPRFLLNTHWHLDHTGGNALWGEQGTVVMAHDNVRARMASGGRIAALGVEQSASPAEALPVVTYGDSAALHFNGDTLELQHYPNGHTDGDSVVYFAAENVVHTGDLFFKDRFPFVDMSSGGTVDGYIAGVQAVLARIDENTVVVPGHGEVASKADLQRFADMLVATRDHVRDRLAAGASVEDVVAEGLGEEWAGWANPNFITEERWIGFLAAE